MNSIANKYKAIDIILNNADTFDYQCRFTNDGLKSYFEVNILSQYIFNTIFKSLVLKSVRGRTINLSGMILYLCNTLISLTVFVAAIGVKIAIRYLQ